MAVSAAATTKKYNPDNELDSFSDTSSVSDMPC